MSEKNNKLGKTLWAIADQLRGAMNADDFRDYMLSFLFLRYLSDNYEAIAKHELGPDYPTDTEVEEFLQLQLQAQEEAKRKKSKKNNGNKKDEPLFGIFSKKLDQETTHEFINRVFEFNLRYSSDDDSSSLILISTPLQFWYLNNKHDIDEFEKLMRRRVHYVIKPDYLWNNIAELARIQSAELLQTLQKGITFIENESFASTFQGLFSEINLDSDKLGKNYAERNTKLCNIITKISEGLAEFSTDTDSLGDAYEYLIGQFAAGSGKKAGEFYTPQEISSILSGIVILDSQDPTTGPKKQLNSVFDFACGSGSLLLNVRNQLIKNDANSKNQIGKIYGQEKNITTYNLARMNMLLHGVKDTEFDIFHGDTLTNDWEYLREANPAKKPYFDAIVANPPFSYRWTPTDALGEDVRFKNHGLAPKSAADFAFLLHGFHYLAQEGTMAIILPHGVLFRGGAEAKIRRKLLDDGHIDTVIGLPPKLFYSTGIPVCILVLKKCKKPDDVLFINASEHFEKDKRQNKLLKEHIDKIVDTYQYRKEEARFSRRVSMEEIAEQNDYNLNISRYVSTALPEKIIDLAQVNDELVEIEGKITAATKKHNEYLKELGLPPLP